MTSSTASQFHASLGTITDVGALKALTAERLHHDLIQTLSAIILQIEPLVRFEEALLPDLIPVPKVKLINLLANVRLAVEQTKSLMNELMENK